MLDLTDRQAVCAYVNGRKPGRYFRPGMHDPVTSDAKKLAFFEYKGPGSKFATAPPMPSPLLPVVRHNWYRPDHKPNPWVKYVDQGPHPGCWIACVSMITGIDYDLFQLMPLGNEGWDGTGQILNSERRAAEQNNLHSRWDSYGGVTPIDRWRKLLALNGFKLTWTKHRPKDIPCIREVSYGRHAVVMLPDGTYLDPNGTYHIYGELDEYTVIREL